ncbi:MAG: 50S ribosomal protein L11 methyltransferase [Clostridiales Family XIII bacterium]|jgi:ribosomal protein L11 methyltransferase|nr:50S ribosomal protein L11 methyltransferase [Clostridiales Family XIII bacterium]
MTAFCETRIYTTTGGVEPVTALLLQHGVDGVAVEDAADIRAIADGKGPTDWDYMDTTLLDDREALVTFYTPDDEAGRALLAAIKIDIMKLKSDELYGLYGADADFGRLYVESIPLTDDWKERWKEGFKPFHVTERFVVCPPWERYTGAGEVIVIDPGMAFGTGSHETTAMCMQALEDSVKPGDKVLDVGAGSGILSVAAVLLGAATVTSVEIDGDAARAARLNFERNGVAAGIELIEDDIRRVDDDGKRYDVTVANLVSGLIAELLPTLAARLAKRGRLILSGLLASEERTMREHAAAAGFQVERSEVKGEWLALYLSLSDVVV